MSVQSLSMDVIGLVEVVDEVGSFVLSQWDGDYYVFTISDQPTYEKVFEDESQLIYGNHRNTWRNNIVAERKQDQIYIYTRVVDKVYKVTVEGLFSDVENKVSQKKLKTYNDQRYKYIDLAIHPEQKSLIILDGMQFIIPITTQNSLIRIFHNCTDLVQCTQYKRMSQFFIWQGLQMMQLCC